MGRLTQRSYVGRKYGHVSPASPKMCSIQNICPHPTHPRYSGRASVHILLEPVASFAAWIPPSLMHFLSWLPALSSPLVMPHCSSLSTLVCPRTLTLTSRSPLIPEFSCLSSWL